MSTNEEGITIDPFFVDQSLAVLCRWRGGGMADALFSVAFTVGQGDPWEALEEIYDQVSFLARYLRQPIPWIEALTLGEMGAYSAACGRLIRAENGLGEDSPRGGSGRERVVPLAEPPVASSPMVPSLLPFSLREER